MTQTTDASSVPVPSPPSSTTPTSLADQLARSRLSAGAASTSGAPPAAPTNGSAYENSDIPPSTSPGVYFCEVSVVFFL